MSEVLDNSGGIAAHYEYDSFGNTIASSGTYATTNAYRFSTKPLDVVSELYYYGFRYYSPSTGRWPSRDSIEERGGVNLYGMVNNNSFNAWDYLGRSIKVDLKFKPGNPQDVSATYVDYGPLPPHVLARKGNTAINYILDCYCTPTGNLECNLWVSFRIQIQKGMLPGDIMGTYGHEQRHVISFMYEARLITKELQDEVNCCATKEKIQEKYLKKLKAAYDLEDAHDNSNSPIAGQDYPIIGRGGDLFSQSFQ